MRLAVQPNTRRQMKGGGRGRILIVKGHQPLSAHITQSLVLNIFDITVINEMEVDHDLTVPVTMMYRGPDEWSYPSVPFAVNVVQYPAPLGKRCYALGNAIRKAIESLKRRIVSITCPRQNPQLVI